MRQTKPILIVDNYDSFTFNLFQMLADVSEIEPVVVTNDTRESLNVDHFDRVVLSPGPGTPEKAADFGICPQFLEQDRVPVLGVCLGHQGLGLHFGARVTRAPEPMHGRTSIVTHDGNALFADIPRAVEVVRYHSLVLQAPLPSCFDIIAVTDDRIIMGIQHRALPFWGVQFHPESICTAYGSQLLKNFCDLGREREDSASRRSVLPLGIRRDSPSDAAENSDTADREGDVASLRVDFRVLPKLYDAERAYTRLYGHKEGSFWLDSSLVDEGLSRFSFIGAADGPLGHELRYFIPEGAVRVRRAEHEERVSGSIFEYLQHALVQRRADCDELPFDFCGGYVGYLGYELKADAGGSLVHQSSVPDANFLFVDRFIAFDHLEQQTYLVSVSDSRDGEASAAWFQEMSNVLEDLAPLAPPVLGNSKQNILLRMDRNRGEYIRDIHTCLEEIRAGETYEVCLTNQLTADVSVDPLTFYRVLRRRNPAPYASFLNFADCAVVSSSPERFMRVGRDGWAESKPIKGTLPRGANPAEDRRLAERLASSEKDIAENLMIVDLVRNDLGRTCEIGSVHVPKLMHVESYATVHQLVSTVRGRIRNDSCLIETIRAAFPGGSMTGAPKIRTMEIIDRLERCARGIYSGSIGFLSLNGAADLNIVIRTAVVTQDTVSLGVGGAIVALSDPVGEYDETVLKAMAPLHALSEVVHGECTPEQVIFRDRVAEPAPIEEFMYSRTGTQG